MSYCSYFLLIFLVSPCIQASDADFIQFVLELAQHSSIQTTLPYSSHYSLDEIEKLTTLPEEFSDTSVNLEKNTPKPKRKYTSTDHTQRIYRCPNPACNKAYFWRSNLAAHLSQKHSSQKKPSSHACPQCFTHYKYESGLKRHLKTHHRQNN